VPLQQDIKDALLNRSGPLGEVLKDVEVYEQGNFAALQKFVDPSFYEVSYRHSLSWAQTVMLAMSEG
jgi:EAL and modified HD-GYP domain-containing signal transduction protein